MTRFPAHRTHSAHHAHAAPRPVRARRRLLASATAIALFAALFAIASLSACGGGGSSPIGADEVVEGAVFSDPGSVQDVSFNSSAAVQGPNCAIDTSSASQGYVGATGNSSSRLKLQVTRGEQSYNYDMPGDGTPVFVPMNMGDGTYTVRVMQNTSGNNYVELLSTSVPVHLETGLEPFLHPNLYCDFNENSASTRRARELTSGADNQAAALRAICDFIANNISYDTAKAEKLSTSTGYIPDPDATLSSGSGICFDYASLGAAMLRSVGIPAQIVTGYVSPDDFYHAWIMVYIDGTWHSIQFTVDPKTWSRVDLTLAATEGGNAYVGDGISYRDRYVY